MLTCARDVTNYHLVADREHVAQLQNNQNTTLRRYIREPVRTTITIYDYVIVPNTYRRRHYYKRDII